MGLEYADLEYADIGDGNLGALATPNIGSVEAHVAQQNGINFQVNQNIFGNIAGGLDAAYENRAMDTEIARHIMFNRESEDPFNNVVDALDDNLTRAYDGFAKILDKTGELVEEVGALTAAGIQIGAAKLAEAIYREGDEGYDKRFDLNGDGQLDFDEVAQAMQTLAGLEAFAQLAKIFEQHAELVGIQSGLDPEEVGHALPSETLVAAAGMREAKAEVGIGIA